MKLIGNIFIGLTLLVFSWPIHARDFQDNQANILWYKGTYEYGLLDSDVVRGTEDWILTIHPDGTRTVHTFVDLRELGHQSNVIMRVDQRHRPLDSYSNFWRFGEYGGGARIWIDDNKLHSSIVGPRGEAGHKITVPDLFSLRLHPVIIEGWQVWHYDKSKPGPQKFPLYNMVTTSATGVRGMGMFQDNVVDFKGTEEVATPVGMLEADHYTFYDGRYDIWLWGEDKILVRYIVPSNSREYRLISLEKGP